MRLAWLALLVLQAAPAFADEVDGDAADALPVDDPAPAGSVQPSEALETQEALDAPQEGVWAWVKRLEGEILTEEAFEALRESEAIRVAEEALANSPSAQTESAEDLAAALRKDPLLLSSVDPNRFDIPVATNRDVQRWMRYFLGSGRRHFERYLARSATYRPLVEAKLAEAGLPQDLIYLAMIESGFNAHAHSHAGASGLWQFMPSTGRMYDLRVDWWVDDRRDPIKSTDAAVAHLADLHRMFKGDWLLAWSAYNAGPGRVRRAMAAGGTRDFWKLARGRHLPTETANYAPKLMAAAIIAKNAESYGFRVEPKAELAVDHVEVDTGASLDVLARCAGIDVDVLRHLNPGLRRFATPAEGYRLNLPQGTADAFLRAFAALPAAERVHYTHHTVKKGDTIGTIAKRYGVSPASVAQLNHLENADRIYVGMSLVIPRGPVAPTPDVSPARVRPDTHTVAAGDALSVLAARYGVSTAQLRTWNQLDGDVIQPGQTLRLHPPAATATRAARTVRYTVVAGDTASGVAARYGVSLDDLRGWNSLSSSATIRVGQVLEIRKPTWRQYTVRAGDSLGRIAQTNGCTVRQLKAWNSLSSDVIHPGQALRIRR